MHLKFAIAANKQADIAAANAGIRENMVTRGHYRYSQDL